MIRRWQAVIRGFECPSAMISMIRVRPGCLVIVCMALCLTSCRGLLTRDDHAVYRTPPERLREIEPVRLAQLSQSEPVSVEEAAANAAARAVAVEEPPESIELNIAEIRAAALANNLDLEVELVNPSLAEEVVAEEEARFEPLFFGSAEWIRLDADSTVLDVPGHRSRLSSFDARVQIPLRTGGIVTVELPFSRFDDQTPSTGTSGNDSNVIDPVYRAGLKFSISQPLLRNAGIRANTHAIRVAKYQRDVADARTRLEAIRILANADRAYWLLYAARRELDVRQKQYDLALQQLEEARQRVAAGAAPKIEIMRAESGLARRLEAIIIADTTVRRSERDLKRIMNRPSLPMESRTAILPATSPKPVGLELDADALADYAVANRMEMLELELQLAIDASTVDLERNTKLPLVTLDYTYTTNGLGDSYNDAFHEGGSLSFADYSIGLTAEIPIGNREAKARLRRAMLQRVQRLATRDRRELAIRQEVYDALDQLAQNWQRILAAGQEVILAHKTWEAERRQFEVGLRTSTEVLEAAARLADAQSREIRALAAYEISQVDIAFATGTLLGQDRVIWTPRALP